MKTITLIALALVLLIGGTVIFQNLRAKPISCGASCPPPPCAPPNYLLNGQCVLCPAPNVVQDGVCMPPPPQPCTNITSWSCWNTANNSPGGCCTENVLFNGTLQIVENNPGGGSNNYGFDTAQIGNFPWSPCSTGASSLVSGINTITVTEKLLTANNANGRYHIYVAPYFYLPNGPVTGTSAAGTATKQCLDTQARIQDINGVDTAVGETEVYLPGDSFGWDQVVATQNVGQVVTFTVNVSQQCQSDLAAYGIPSSTTCILMGIEIGTEGYSNSGTLTVAANFYNLQLT